LKAPSGKATLRRLFARRETRERLADILQYSLFPVAIRDADDVVLFESWAKQNAVSHPRAPITLDGETVGWVCGEGAVALGAKALELLLRQEAEKKAIATEALHRYKELTLLYEFGGRLSSERGTTEELVRLVAQEARQALPGDVFRLLRGPDADHLAVKAAVTGPRVAGGEAPPLPDETRAAAAQAYRSERSDVTVSPEGATERSHLCVPIRTPKETIGVLSIASFDADAFSSAELKLATGLAVMGSLAIDNARAADELRAHRDHLEELVQARTQKLEQTLAALETANQELDRLSHVDALTGLENRRSFDRLLAQEWERARRNRHSISVAMIDVDFFKRYNDVYGHRAGDQCLHQVARALASVVQRQTDVLARYGGEEFVVILPSLTADAALALGERLLAAVRALAIPHEKSEASSVVTISGGIAATIPELDEEPSSLVETADRALYEAKRAGRNRFACAGSGSSAPRPNLQT
jgi:diguanylate cyclase (GGDEF)-like protein